MTAVPPSETAGPTGSNDLNADDLSDDDLSDVDAEAPPLGGVRRALLRGMGVVLPPLLTIVVLIWAWNAIENYVLTPVQTVLRDVIVWQINDTKLEIPKTAIQPVENGEVAFRFEGKDFVADPVGQRYLPLEVVQTVDAATDSYSLSEGPPKTARGYWRRFVEVKYLPRFIFVPVFLVCFLGLLWFLGRIFTGGIGRWMLHSFDSAILSVPVVNKVYGSVKQITDFAFDDREIEFNRVVAIQYPREGIWSLGFVTGSSLREISEAAGEPMLSVLMPTSPMPMTGFTVTIRRSEAIDMNLTIDEAIQFIVSCGVVVPTGQQIIPPVESPPVRPTRPGVAVASGSLTPGLVANGG